MRSYSFLFWAFATAIAAHAFFIQLATALPATDIDVPAVNTTSTPFTCWAQFCDDDNCSVNCGEWVDMQNPGCLNEANRRSIHVKSNGPDPLVGLVYSPTQDCPCQTECDDFGGINPDCWPLNVERAAVSQSYRFIGWGKGDGAGGQCDGAKDNCPAKYDELDAPEATTPVDVEVRTKEEVDLAADSFTDAEHDNVVEQTTDVQQATDIQRATDIPESHPDVAVDDQPLTNTDLTDPTNLTHPHEMYDGGWARFCNDANCTEGCGQWVSLTNSGCLTENSRGSIAMKNTGANIRVGLVYSPTDHCDCQTRCTEEIPEQFASACFTLDPDSARDSHSYRLINWGWDEPCYGALNNC